MAVNNDNGLRLQHLKEAWQYTIEAWLCETYPHEQQRLAPELVELLYYDLADFFTDGLSSSEVLRSKARL